MPLESNTPHRLHVRVAGRGRVFIIVAVNAQDYSFVKGALVNIYDAGEYPDDNSAEPGPLFTGYTNEYGALNPVPCFNVSHAQGKRVLLVHVVGTRLEEFVVCRSARHYLLKPADLESECQAIKKKMFGTRLIRAMFAGWRLGGEALRK